MSQVNLLQYPKSMSSASYKPSEDLPSLPPLAVAVVVMLLPAVVVAAGIEAAAAGAASS
jgi:hypothetical protein